jgi:hypothetical protein
MVSYPAADASYRTAASMLTPQAVSEYLAFSGWELESRESTREIWHLSNRDGELIGRVMLPLASDYADYQDRFYDALMSIGKINEWSSAELQEHITATHADLLFVRLDQPTINGTISIAQARATINAILDMLSFAAMTAVGIRRPRKGQVPPEVVTNFLEHEARLGHTKQGSFTFMVAALLGDELQTRRIADNTKIFPSDQVAFPRQVMEILARSLEAVGDVGRLAQIRAPEVGLLLSPRLMDAVNDIVVRQDVQAIEISFQWASSLPSPNVTDQPIRLERRSVEDLHDLTFEASTVAEPERSQRTLIGHVRSLTRKGLPEDQNSESEIVLRTEIFDRIRNVYFSLSGDDNITAISAYLDQLPLTVTGDLVFERQRWRLVGDIQLEASGRGLE